MNKGQHGGDRLPCLPYVGACVLPAVSLFQTLANVGCCFVVALCFLNTWFLYPAHTHRSVCRAAQEVQSEFSAYFFPSLL